MRSASPHNGATSQENSQISLMTEEERAAFDALSMALLESTHTANALLSWGRFGRAPANSTPQMANLPEILSAKLQPKREIFTDLRIALMPRFEPEYESFHAESIQEFLYWLEQSGAKQPKPTQIPIHELVEMAQNHAQQICGMNMIVRVMGAVPSCTVSAHPAHILHCISHCIAWLNMQLEHSPGQLGIHLAPAAETGNFTLTLAASRLHAGSGKAVENPIIVQLLAELAGVGFEYHHTANMRAIVLGFNSHTA